MIGSSSGKLLDIRSATILRMRIELVKVRIAGLCSQNSYLPNTVVPLTFRSRIQSSVTTYVRIQIGPRVLSSGSLFKTCAASGPIASTWIGCMGVTINLGERCCLTYFIDAACRSRRWVFCCWEIKIVSAQVGFCEPQCYKARPTFVITISPRTECILNGAVRKKSPPCKASHEHWFSSNASNFPNHGRQIRSH